MALAAAVTALAAACPPVFTVEAADAGTGYAFGRAIGRRFGGVIRDRFRDSLLQQQLLPFVATQDGARTLQSLTAAAEQRFPEYMEELRGTAAGAAVPLQHVLCMNLRNELLAAAGAAAAAPSSCSDYVVTGPDAAFVAHNEDGADPHNNHTYIVRVPPSAVSRGFTALVYAGELPSAAFGWNAAGVGFTLNSLHGVDLLNPDGVGRNFVSRHALEAGSVDAAADIAQMAGRALVHNWQIFSRGRVVSVEVGRESGHTRHIDMAGDAYFHANCYLYNSSSDRSKQPWTCKQPNADSQARMTTASSYPVPADLRSALAVLGDTTGDYPIYAPPSRPALDGRTTLVTPVFDLRTGSVELLSGNPVRQDACLRFSMW